MKMHKGTSNFRGRTLIVVLALGALAGSLGVVVHSRCTTRAELVSSAKDAGRTPVSVVHPHRANAETELVLPANVQAFVETPVYARTDGYLKRWLVDIGSKVKAGQLLAEIETPEVDQQLKLMEASLAQAQANLDLARTTAERWKNLLQFDGVSKQEVDQNVAIYKARQADLKAAVANVDRLKDMQSFQKVVARFDGTITTRNVDVGGAYIRGNDEGTFSVGSDRCSSGLC